MSTIRLLTSDGITIHADPKVANFSGTIKTYIEEFAGDADMADLVVPLQNVHSVILRKFLEWADHHKDDAVPLDNTVPTNNAVPTNSVVRTNNTVPTNLAANPKKQTFSSWDENFVKMELGKLLTLITAAKYLDSKELLNLTCCTVADMIKGKTPEEIRKTFNMIDDDD